MGSSSSNKTTSALPTSLDSISKPKLARRSNDSKVHKRPIARNQPPQQRGNAPTPNPKHQRIIHIGSKSPFMSIVSRVRKALEHGPAGMIANSITKGLPLTARLAALSAGMDGEGQSEKEEVLVRGTGRAIAKTLHLAAWFTRQTDMVVNLRTMTLETVDEILLNEDRALEEGGFAAEEERRVRRVNCLEVGVRLR